MISFSDIEEFPFSGRIYRIIESSKGDDEEDTVYEGVMDVNLSVAESGSTAQTSDYVVSIPLIKGEDGKYINPVRNEDWIECDVMGEQIKMQVDNSIPSMLGAITIYANRKGGWR